MKVVKWTDEEGYLHRALLRDDDSDELAQTAGIPVDPPDLRHLDWDGLIRDLHNLLVERELVTWDDVVAAQNGVTSSIKTIFKRPIIGLYRSESRPDSPELGG